MSSSTATNMYRVGDYVYFEINSSSPFQIRRIEELNKTQAGNVEAKVMCFYRRRDIAPALLKIIDDRPAPGSTAVPAPAALAAEIPVSTAVPTETAQPAPLDEPKVDLPEEESKHLDDVVMKDEEETVKDPVHPSKEESSPAPTPMDDSTEKETKPAEMEVTTKSEETPTKSAETPTKLVDVPTKSEETATTTTKPVDAEMEAKPDAPTSVPVTTPKTAIRMPGEDELSEIEKHKLLHRELFLSRQIETLPATHIRGKCSVTLLNEIETPDSYLGRDDMFFYSLVYDPAQKTLIADKGEIRIGDKYQAEVPEQLSEEEKENWRKDGPPLETMIYQPYHSLTDRQIDQFVIVARAVGTFARALDMSSSAKQPNLHLTAAAASRDVTPFQSLALLHQADYDLSKAMCFLVPPAHKQWYPIDADKATALHTSTLGGPLMCRDQLEEWSAAEANLFDEALEKYGKDFNDIRQDFLPWKALRDIVEYYYMWKTTDRYVQQKRVKANEAESRLKQVYIPAYTKPNPNVLSVTNPYTAQSNKCCEGCSADSCDQWYSWGPPGSYLRLCKDCWTYWKKFGGLKRPHPYESFDKTAYQHSDQVTSTVPRPSDRLEAFDTNVRRCPVVGCSRQFPNPQLLNQHIRRDHFQCDDVDSSSSPAIRNVASVDGAPVMMGRNIQGPTALRPGAPRTRASFYIRTTPMTKVARRLAPKSLLNVKRSARNPFDPINMLAIKQHCQSQSTSSVRSVLKTLLKNVPASASLSAPPSVGTKPTPSSVPKNVTRSGAPVTASFPQKRSHNGCSWDNEPASKKFKGANELFMKWIRTPDDCYFHATKSSKTIRNVLNNGQVRRAGRRPYRMQEFVAALLRGHSLTA